MHRDTRLDGVRRAVRVLGPGFEGAAGPVEPVKPSPRIAVPERAPEAAEPMERGRAEVLVVREGPKRLGREQGLSGLEFEELVVRTQRPPGAVEVAEEAAMLDIETAREPRVEHVLPQGRFELPRGGQPGVLGDATAAHGGHG